MACFGSCRRRHSAGFFSELLLSVNLVLGLFNLVPAFPMDGGRVLRALLSGWVGRARATIDRRRGSAEFLAVCLGRLLPCCGPQNPIHLALAAFIYFAAQAEEAQVLLRGTAPPVGIRRRPRTRSIWTAPPGYRWVNRGNGHWQLAPITVWFGRSRNRTPPLALTPIVELGVAEAYAILTERFGVVDLPPLDAIENEDWGRDFSSVDSRPPASDLARPGSGEDDQQAGAVRRTIACS